MISNDERREVARRLREIRPCKSGHIKWWEIARALGLKQPDGWFGWEKFETDSVNRLADLIEPSESGQNRDRNQDSVQKESHIVQIDHECDRDALLKLADDLDGMGDGSMYDPCISDEYGIASRIREILGV